MGEDGLEENLLQDGVPTVKNVGSSHYGEVCGSLMECSIWAGAHEPGSEFELGSQIACIQVAKEAWSDSSVSIKKDKSDAGSDSLMC